MGSGLLGALLVGSHVGGGGLACRDVHRVWGFRA